MTKTQKTKIQKLKAEAANLRAVMAGERDLIDKLNCELQFAYAGAESLGNDFARERQYVAKQRAVIEELVNELRTVGTEYMKVREEANAAVTDADQLNQILAVNEEAYEHAKTLLISQYQIVKAMAKVMDLDLAQLDAV